jgi:hypothetical protein
MDDPLGVLGDVWLVSHQDNRAALPVQVVKQCHDFLAGLGV